MGYPLPLQLKESLMRCSALVKIWNPNLHNWDGTGTFNEKFFIFVICPTTTKITSAKCWKKWKLCGRHAAILHPNHYPKGSAPRKGGGRYGNDRHLLPFNQVVPIRIRKKSNKRINTNIG